MRSIFNAGLGSRSAWLIGRGKSFVPAPSLRPTPARLLWVISRDNGPFVSHWPVQEPKKANNRRRTNE